MGLELLRRLDTSAVDLSFKRYHNQSTAATFKGGGMIGKHSGEKAFINVTLEWETETVIENMDGGKLNPGNVLKQVVRIPAVVTGTDENGQEIFQPDGSEQATWRLNDLAYAALALGHPRPKGDEKPPMPTDEDIGKRVNLFLTYKPSKNDPNDPSQGNQNFRISAIRA